MVNACGWVESIAPCVACPQCDGVLPGVLLLPDMEDCLFLPVTAAIPLVQARFLRRMDQEHTNRTPSAPQHPRGPDVSCSVMGRILLTNHRLAAAPRHSLGGWQASLALVARKWGKKSEAQRWCVGSCEEGVILPPFLSLLVTPLLRSGDQPTALQQNFMEWECIRTVPEGKGQ